MRSEAQPKYTSEVVDGRLHIAIPMQRPYLPIPQWVVSFDVLSVVLIPLWLIGSVIVRTIRSKKVPPRADFMIGQEEFSMRLCDRETGVQTSIECPLTSIVEFRKNEFEKGLWVHINNKRKETILKEMDDETIKSLCSTIQSYIESND
ncbi:hypothetical protein [Adhaeretor mobilis]|uniref:Uncharacterized protein n=1 Tax=Adhaeretor mobilis TaxID=1930276 RepID=A0A517N086_9BACT|nr:hypothetical protein [Adhaeretor mobilis]QDT00550.1 hypothetical protein HG15A2_38880 [Adhaeretor mobilis]